MKDGGEPNWHLRIYELAHSIVEIYLGAAGGPVILAEKREALWNALVVRIAELVAAGHTPSEVGSRVGDTVEEWERKHQFGPGPRRFRVTSPDEVEVET